MGLTIGRWYHVAAVVDASNNVSLYIYGASWQNWYHSGTYGGAADTGGGAFSGKDPTKVDRSAGYMARYVAKSLVAAGLAEECLVQLGYCIGLVDPVSVMVNSYETGKLSDEALSELVRKVFPLSPHGIIDHLKLRQPVYLKTAAYGHFGRPEFTWERVDATDELLASANRIGQSGGSAIDSDDKGANNV
jgi:S-adenosylmethionine synthetase